jgi:hypothetical protein
MNYVSKTREVKVSLAQRAFDAMCEANSSDGHRATVGSGEFKSLTAVYRFALLVRSRRACSAA